MLKKVKNKLDALMVLDFKINSEFEKISSRKFKRSKDFQKLIENAGTFIELKKTFKMEISNNDVVTVKEKVEREFFKKIVEGEEFLGDTIIKCMYEAKQEKYDLEDYNINELMDLTEDFYSWFGPYEYARRLIEIGVLISPLSIPQSVLSFVNEARQCYAFQRYNAVYSLCRTIIESSIRDIGIRIGKIDKSVKTYDFYKDYPPRKLIHWTSYGILKEKLQDTYSELSTLIHGYKTIDGITAKKALQETLLLVQELYEKNAKKIKN